MDAVLTLQIVEAPIIKICSIDFKEKENKGNLNNYPPETGATTTSLALHNLFYPGLLY